MARMPAGLSGFHWYGISFIVKMRANTQYLPRGAGLLMVGCFVLFVCQSNAVIVTSQIKWCSWSLFSTGREEPQTPVGRLRFKLRTTNDYQDRVHALMPWWKPYDRREGYFEVPYGGESLKITLRANPYLNIVGRERGKAYFTIAGGKEEIRSEFAWELVRRISSNISGRTFIPPKQQTYHVGSLFIEVAPWRGQTILKLEVTSESDASKQFNAIVEAFMSFKPFEGQPPLGSDRLPHPED